MPRRANNMKIRVSVGVTIIFIMKVFVKIYNMQLLPKKRKEYKNNMFLASNQCIEKVNCG